MRNGIIISVLFIKAIFYKLPKRRYILQPTKYEHKDVREGIDSNYSLNALNFGRL